MPSGRFSKLGWWLAAECVAYRLNHFRLVYIYNFANVGMSLRCDFTIFLCTCIIKICSNCSKRTKIYNSYYWRSLYYFLFWLGWISTILYWLNRKPQTINAKMTNLLSLEDPPFLRFVAPILEHIVSVLNWDSLQKKISKSFFRKYIWLHMFFDLTFINEF